MLSSNQALPDPLKNLRRGKVRTEPDGTIVVPYFPLPRIDPAPYGNGTPSTIDFLKPVAEARVSPGGQAIEAHARGANGEMVKVASAPAVSSDPMCEARQLLDDSLRSLPTP